MKDKLYVKAKFDIRKTKFDKLDRQEKMFRSLRERTVLSFKSEPWFYDREGRR